MPPVPRKKAVARDPEQIAAMKSRLRRRICDVVYNMGEATVGQIAEQLDVRPSSLYRHLRILVEAELIDEGEPMRTTKNFAATFRARGSDLWMDGNSDDPAIRSAIAGVIEAQLRNAGREYRVGIESGELPLGKPASPLKSGSTIGWLTKSDLKKLNDLLEQAYAVFEGTRPAPGRELHALTFVSRPVVHSAADRER